MIGGQKEEGVKAGDVVMVWGWVGGWRGLGSGGEGLL